MNVEAGNSLKFVPTINANLRKYMIRTKIVFIDYIFQVREGRSSFISLTPSLSFAIFTNLLAL